MSMDEFLKTLTEEQKQALLRALSGGDFKQEQPPAEEPRMSEDDFTMNKHRVSSLPSNGRREPVRARENTWTDEGESKDIKTPDAKRTPRNRAKPKLKTVKCHVCGKEQKVNASIVYGEFYRCNRCI